MKNNTTMLHAKSSAFAGLILAGRTLKGAGMAAVATGGLLVAAGDKTEEKGQHGHKAAKKQIDLINADKAVASHKEKVEKAKRQLERAEAEYEDLSGLVTATVNV